MNFKSSQARSPSSKIESQPQQFHGNSSLARRLDDEKNSKITQYFNVANRSFQNSQNAIKNPKPPTERSDNFYLQPFSSFPSENFEIKKLSSPKNQLSFTQQNFYTHRNNNTENQNLLLNSKHQNLKESKVQQSLQKAFSLNRNSHRIPFKKKQNSYQCENINQAQKSCKFYEPSYDEYFSKQDKRFWIEAFEKFYEKRGSMQNIDFPSFHNKDQSKSTESYCENNKKNDILKQKESFQKDGINNIVSNKSWLNTILLIAIFIVGLIILLFK